MNTENSKKNESNRFRYNFTNKLNLKNPNTNIALANLSIYYTWKNIKSEYNNNEFKIHSGSYLISDIQDYFEFIIKKHETITYENCPTKFMLIK